MATSWISGYDARDFGNRKHSQPVLGLAVLDDNAGTLFQDDADLQPLTALYPDPEPGSWWVVPCSAEKLNHAAPARELYTGTMFRHTYRAACAAAARDRGSVLILSAAHGLIDPGQLLAPYELKLGAIGSVTAARVARQAAALGIEDADAIHALLPREYHQLLRVALGPEVINHYEGARGIGDQRKVNAQLMGGAK